MGKLKVKRCVVYLGDKKLLRDERFAADEDAAQLCGVGVGAEGEERSGGAQEEAEERAGRAAAGTGALELGEAHAAVDDGDAEAVEQELAAMAALGLPVSFTCGGGLGAEGSGRRGGDAGGEQQHSLGAAVDDDSVERVRCAVDGWLQSYDTSTGSLFYHRQGTHESVWQLAPGELCHHPLPADQLAWAAAHAASLAPVPVQQAGGDEAVVTLHGRSLQPCGVHIRFTGEDGAPASASEATPASQAECPHDKYWAQRYRFFSRFDEGCCITGDMWFSVTPEVIAIHQARRLSRLVHGDPAHAANKERAAVKVMVAIDAFSGCGGNAIACARERAYVLACDLSPLRLAETQHNAGVYGVAQYLDCVAADWTTLSQAMARHGRLDLAHAVFLSPPWGGPAYAEAGTFDLHAPLAGGQSAKQLLGAALSLAPVAAIFLPKNLRTGDVVQMATDAGAEKATMEQALLNGKLKAVTVYASRGRRSTPKGKATPQDAVEVQQDGTVERVTCQAD